VAVIAEEAFSGCSELSQIVFLKDGALTEIGDRAFAHCGKLVSIDINTRITRFGSQVFYQCTSLCDVRLAAVDHIGPASFAECPLKIIHLPRAFAINAPAASGRMTYAGFLAMNPVLSEAFPPSQDSDQVVDVRWV
jgi:hypothetical protein